tara:strand:+ start:884 stop:1048 length:165 start_codon:yes stop_codon:yes gene_type:complete
MAKMNKTQAKKAYESILQKSSRLIMDVDFVKDYQLSGKDYLAIERIVMKYLKKF